MDSRHFEIDGERLMASNNLVSMMLRSLLPPKLELNDGSKTVVARDHRSNSGIVGKPRQAHFEIVPGFEQLADILLITYVYAEHLRRKRNRDGSPYYIVRAARWFTG
jgi:hypothetical protein